MSENPISITKEELTELIVNLDIDKLHFYLTESGTWWPLVDAPSWVASILKLCKKEDYKAVLKELDVPFEDLSMDLGGIRWRYFPVADNYIVIEFPNGSIRVEKTNLAGIRKTVAFLRELQEHSS